MKHIEILYFEGCPNHPPAVAFAQRVADTLGLDVHIKEVEVHGPETAQAMRFLGSPSIRVDGIDIEPDARSRTDFGYSCRTYAGQGLPSDALLIAALGGETRSSKTEAQLGLSATAGSVLAAMLASACCWIPLMLIGVGASAGGVAALFETTRPFFLTAAVLMLSIGFYFAYFRSNSAEACSTCEGVESHPNRLNRTLLWMSVVGVAVFSAFPSYVGAFAAESDVAAEAGGFVVDVHVSGMTCDGCAVILHNALVAVPGVTGVDVQFEESLAKVTVTDPDRPMEAALLATVERAGYTGSFDLAQAPPKAIAPAKEEDSVEETTLNPLESVDALKTQFNADKGKRRLLLLFSPT